jgi:hypothetical protein
LFEDQVHGFGLPVSALILEASGFAGKNGACLPRRTAFNPASFATESGSFALKRG